MAEVTAVKRGAVMCHVKVKLKSSEGLVMSSVMTLESLDDMGVEAGDQVEVVVKAVNVLLMKP